MKSSEDIEKLKLEAAEILGHIKSTLKDTNGPMRANPVKGTTRKQIEKELADHVHETWMELGFYLLLPAKPTLKFEADGFAIRAIPTNESALRSMQMLNMVIQTEIDQRMIAHQQQSKGKKK